MKIHYLGIKCLPQSYYNNSIGLIQLDSIQHNHFTYTVFLTNFLFCFGLVLVLVLGFGGVFFGRSTQLAGS